MKIYHYPKCSTCVKAIKFLNSRDVKFEAIDITITPPSKSELNKMLKHYDGDIKKLFNTSGVQYRELKIAEKLKSMSAKQAVDLLATNGRLIKRPFVLTSKTGLVGFNEDEWKSYFPAQ